MSTLNAKRRCGINLEDAINICLTGLNKGKGIIYNGVQYPSIRRCCLLNNISYDGFIHFMKYNLNKQSSINIQDALDLYLSSHSIVYRGVKYSSKRECAEAFGTSMQVINRVKIRNSYNKGGTTFNEILDEILYKTLDNCSIEYNGIVYKNKLDCCEALDLNYTDVTLLCNKYNYTFSVAVYTLLTLGARYIKYRGSFYKTRDGVYNTFGLCYATVINIMRRIGCKWESAVDYALIRKNYYVRGFVYSENGLGSSCFKCKCKNCGLSFLFTADLAFGHIQNCYNESVGV